MLPSVSFVAVYYTQIKKIEAHVIQDHEEYSMIAFHLDAEGKLPERRWRDCRTSCLACMAHEHHAPYTSWQQQCGQKRKPGDSLFPLHQHRSHDFMICSQCVAHTLQPGWQKVSVSFYLQERANTGCIGSQVNMWLPSKCI